MQFNLAKLSKFGIAFAIIGVVLTVVIISNKQFRRQKSRGDIEVYAHAARLVVNQENIYEIPTERGKLFYLYLPLFAVLMIPLAYLPMEIVIVLWCVFNIFLVGWIILTFYEAMTGKSFFALPLKEKWIIGFVPLMLTIRTIVYHLDLAQANIPVLAVAVWGMKFLSERKDVGAGIAAGFSVILKVITFPLAILFFVRRDWRVVAGIFFGVILGLIIPALIIGFEQNLFYIDYWVRTVVVSQDISQSYHWEIKFNFSPEAQLYRFFSSVAAFDYNGKDFSVTIFELPKQVIQLMAKAVFASLALAIAFYGFYYRKSCELIGKWGGIALCFSLMPIFSPVTQKHYFVMMLPAHIYAVYLWHFLPLKDRWFRGLLVASFVVMTLCTNLFGYLPGAIMTNTGGLIWGTLLLSASIFRAAKCLGKTERKSVSTGEIETL